MEIEENNKKKNPKEQMEVYLKKISRKLGELFALTCLMAINLQMLETKEESKNEMESN